MTSMTAERIDVNEAFRTERSSLMEAQRAGAERRKADFEARKADGRLVPTGNGMWRSTEQWDRGEVFRFNEEGLALPQHGLDLSKGYAALYSRAPQWHELGNIVPEGVTDVDEVLRLGGIDFDVVRRPACYQVEEGGPFRVAPEQFIIIRTDTGASLGACGKIWTPVQNRDQFDHLQLLIENDAAVWESAGALLGGKRVFVSVRLPRDIVIDPSGIADMIVPFLVSVNGHDGRSSFERVITPWRPGCANTERFALRDSVARYTTRHSPNVLRRVDEAREALGLTVTYYEEFEREQNALAATALAIDDYLKVVDEVWEIDEDAPEKTVRNADTRRELLVKLWDENAARLGYTGYAAERAMTEFLDHHTQIKPRGDLKGKHSAARATALLIGDADEVKSKVHRQLLLRTR